MKFALTGTSSVIGAYLVKGLQKLGYELFCFSRDPVARNDIFFDIEKPEIIEHDCKNWLELSTKMERDQE